MLTSLHALVAAAAVTSPGRLVLVRHGQSVWNDLNLFTGWADPGLTLRGRDEAANAGALLRTHGISVDTAFCSRLRRASQTLDLVLSELDADIPVIRSWRLNEQHCGALTGENKRDLALQYGEEIVFDWRRNPRSRPPAAQGLLPEVASRLGSRIAPVELRRSCRVDGPSAESLIDACNRYRPLWRHGIGPLLRRGKTVLVAGHGNMLRGAVREIEGLSDERMSTFELPQATPVIFEFDSELHPVTSRAMLDDSENVIALTGTSGYFLGDEDRVRRLQAQSAAAHSHGPRLDVLDGVTAGAPESSRLDSGRKLKMGEVVPAACQMTQKLALA